MQLVVVFTLGRNGPTATRSLTSAVVVQAWALHHASRRRLCWLLTLWWGVILTHEQGRRPTHSSINLAHNGLKCHLIWCTVFFGLLRRSFLTCCGHRLRPASCTAVQCQRHPCVAWLRQLWQRLQRFISLSPAPLLHGRCRARALRCFPLALQENRGLPLACRQRQLSRPRRLQEETAQTPRAPRVLRRRRDNAAGCGCCCCAG
mmetsp:Transcript_44893/g.106535  ORF Transcript_44893/g.106535 Transcript_44893/m.106535 type:complete len:204 (-) Transcript_44893:436-1047(-)